VLFKNNLGEIMMIPVKGKNGIAIIYANEVDNETISLLYNFLNHPASKGARIRVMPDCHAGKGIVVGFTATLTDCVIPNVIGVDIGCGVQTICVGKKIPSFDELDQFIRENIPAGFNVHQDVKHLRTVPKDFFKEVEKVAKRTQQDFDYVFASLGTLGGGNHFIEVGVDEQERYWLTVHTGSRNFGLKVANYHQRVAEQTCRKELLQQEIEKLKKQYSGKELGEKISQLKADFQFSKALSFLTGERAKAYIEDMKVAQEYATWNRKLIVNSILSAFGLKEVERIESVHNYIDFKDRIIRKGAIRSHKGERIVIPMNMSYGVIIGTGKGNPAWNFSAPHGAGRRMSRSEARKKLSVEEFRKEMKRAGVYSNSIGEHTLDEAPQAYKDPNSVLVLLEKTVEITSVVRAVYNFKS